MHAPLADDLRGHPHVAALNPPPSSRTESCAGSPPTIRSDPVAKTLRRRRQRARPDPDEQDVRDRRAEESRGDRPAARPIDPSMGERTPSADWRLGPRRGSSLVITALANHSSGAIYAVAALALFGVVVRPWRTPEVAWAVAGAAALVPLGLVPAPAAMSAIGKGLDVYLFLVGMMLLSAIAEREGLFDHLAAVCVRRANGSPTRLFALVYAVGTVVTVFMSNDATAVVLTPAVLAVTKKADAKPLPYLLACALSPTRRASCCPSRTRPTWSSSATSCLRSRRGSRASCCPRCSRSPSTLLGAALALARRPRRPHPRRRRGAGADAVGSVGGARRRARRASC